MSDQGEAWLDQLESTVQQAAETIATLRRERDDLVHRVEELEAAGGKGKGKGKGDDTAASWKKERQEIRRRVQKLTERLEGLLDE